MKQNPRSTLWASKRWRALTNPVLPLALMVGFVILSVMAWSALHRQVEQQVSRTVDKAANARVSALERRFNQHIQALERMADRFARNPSLQQAEWHKDAKEIREDYRFFESIQWINKNYTIRWNEPRAGHKNLIGFNVVSGDDGTPASEIKTALKKQKPGFSRIRALKQGGAGIIAYAPVVTDDRSGGYIAGAFRVGTLLNTLAPGDHHGFKIEVTKDDKVRYSVSRSKALAPDLAAGVALDIPQINWRLRLTPTQQWLSTQYQDWSLTALISLLILGVMISSAVWLAQLTQIRNRSLRDTKERLENEMTEREAVQQDLAHSESTDALTGLPNRRFFIEDLTHSLAIADRNSQQMALITLDLDRFRLLNDSMGHQFGDELLRSVADRLSQLGSEKLLVAYSSGDEFLLIQQHIESIDDVIALLRDIKQRFSEAFQIQGQDYRITATMGVAIYPDGGTDTDVLMRNADVALYRAKENGRNQYQFYTEGMQHREITRLQLDKDLCQALKEDHLVLHFQPQIDLATGHIGSVEALVRWQHPVHGLLSPGEFIPLAEESGRIGAIGRWVTLAACHQLAAWRGTRFEHLRIAINLSGHELDDENLVDNIEQILIRNGLKGHQLEVELTEEIFVDNIDQNLEQLKRLHDLGVHLAIDDFGTGYSSLAYLRDFPVNVLKIDQAFIAGVSERHDDAAITRAVINLSHNLGIQVIAEGIETNYQLDFLRAHHCDLAQGFFIGRPMPLAELEEWIRQGFSLTEIDYR